MTREVVPVLLAAGSSSRFDGGHKLLAPLDLGEGPRPVVAHALAALRAAFGGPPLVVTGARADAVKTALGGPAIVVRNPDHASGMGTSLALAARRVMADASGRETPPVILIALGDMPLVSAATCRAVVAALPQGADGAARAVVAGSSPRPGHPVALGPAWLPVLAGLSGDEGLRTILAKAPVAMVPVDPRTQVDVDTREALARAASYP